MCAAALFLALCATVGADKVGHATAGALTAAYVSQVSSREVGLLAAIAVGIGKEFYDSTGRGTVEAADAIATGLGGLITYTALGITDRHPGLAVTATTGGVQFTWRY